jgi:hypothetical protein
VDTDFPPARSLGREVGGGSMLRRAKQVGKDHAQTKSKSEIVIQTEPISL